VNRAVVASLNRDSAVQLTQKSEEQTFRREVGARRALPLHLRPSDVGWLIGNLKPTRNSVRKSENDFETAPSDVFATPASRLAHAGSYFQLRNPG
jgi:hypothetical protein